MKGVLLVSLLLAPPRDQWFGRDKIKHFFVSAFAQSVSFSLLRVAGMEGPSAVLGASALTATVSVGKEVRDRRAGGPFSARDLVWDAAGAGAATLYLSRTQ